jgi:single-strand DNA-binding protein
MAGVNKVILVGNLGKDPELSTVGESQVAEFSLAVNRTFTSKGEQVEETEWFMVKCWNKLAELVMQYLVKGRQVYVEGRLKTRSWEDATTGEKKYRTDVIANDITFLGSRPTGESAEVKDDNLPF